MATTVASLNAVLSLSSKAFEKGMQRARGTSRRFGRSIRNVSRIVSRFGGRLAALAGVGGVAGIGFLIKRQVDLLDQLAKTSTKLGIQADQLAGLRRAAQLTGVAVRTFDMGLQRFSRRLAEASVGTGEAQAALKELGIDAKALVRLPLQRQLFAVADAMNKVEDQSQRIRLGFKLFDSEGVALINTMALGAEGLREVIRETKAMGLTFSRLDLRRVEVLKDTFTDMGAAINSATAQMAFQMVPVIDAVANAFGGVGNIAVDTQGFIRGIGETMKITAITVAGMLDRMTANFMDLEAELHDLSRSFLFGDSDEAARVLANNLRKQADEIRSGGGNFVNSLLEGIEKSINRVGDTATRFGIQRSAIPDMTAAAAAGMRAGSQLAGARALGIVGNQPRFGSGIAAPRVERDMRSLKDSNLTIADKVTDIYAYMLKQRGRFGLSLTVGP